jgi:hypothetical protein
VARDLLPESVEPYLDVPAYRYQRILYPLAARVFSFGQQSLLPWTLIGLNWLFHGFTTLILTWQFQRNQIPARYALVYGLWVGLVAAVGLDLHEPIAYGLIVLAWFFRQRKNDLPYVFCLGLAMFAKETTIVFWAAAFLEAIVDPARKKLQLPLLAGGVFFGLWQIWLWFIFGEIGLGSGGDMATGFEWIPLMGFLRIGWADWRVFGLFTLIFGPTILLPTFWALREVYKQRALLFRDWTLLALLLHAVLIVFLPFSTFREPLGLVRIATGLVLTILLVSTREGYRRVMNYSLFWIAMLAILLPQG